MNAQILANRLYMQTTQKGLSFKKVADNFNIPNIYGLKNGQYERSRQCTFTKLKMALEAVSNAPSKIDNQAQDISSEVKQCFRLASALHFSMGGLYVLFEIDKSNFYKWGSGEQKASLGSKTKVIKLLKFLEEIKNTAEKIRGKTIFE